LIFAGIAVSFVGLAGTIVLLAGLQIIGAVMAKLMLVALLGMYIGFGVLIAVYRFTRGLD
jgi:hypothetical protein